MTRPAVKLYSRRICVSLSQPAFAIAGVMWFWQISASFRAFLSLITHFLRCDSSVAQLNRPPRVQPHTERLVTRERVNATDWGALARPNASKSSRTWGGGFAVSAGALPSV